MNKVKDFISIFRDGSLLCLFFLLLFFPALFNGILERAGFTEGSFMGFTWKEKAIESKQVADSSQQLATRATQQMEAMQAQLDNISKKLAVLPATTNTPEVHAITASLDSSKKQFTSYKIELNKNVIGQKEKLNNIFKQSQYAQPK